jgi:hypothetical protein
VFYRSGLFLSLVLGQLKGQREAEQTRKFGEFSLLLGVMTAERAVPGIWITKAMLKSPLSKRLSGGEGILVVEEEGFHCVQEKRKGKNL